MSAKPGPLPKLEHAFLNKDAAAMTNYKSEREWIIQRCLNEKNYEPWPGYSEQLLTRAEMIQKLDECCRRWPELEFRGCNAVNSTVPGVRLKIVGLVGHSSD